MHPDKPTQVTRTIGNTIFGAISGERPIDWAIIFMELVNWLVGGGGKSKPTPICPFLYHLYESKGLLTEDEETDYKSAQELNRYGITPERDPGSESEVRLITGPPLPNYQPRFCDSSSYSTGSVAVGADSSPQHRADGHSTELGREALTTPTTGTGLNLVNLSTPGSTNQEHLRREEERMKRKADDVESESSSSEEEEEESLISLDSDKEEYRGSDTPSDLGRPGTPPYQVNRPVTQSTPRKKSSHSKRKAA